MDGIIFDLDGVICGTDKYHFEAWREVMKKVGVELDESVNTKIRGVSRMVGLDRILEGSGVDLTTEEKLDLSEEKNTLYVSLLNDMSEADMYPGVKEVLFELKRRGIKMAIGSSSKNAKRVLEKIGLGDFFDAVSDGNGIQRAKPDPEVFLRAAKMISLEPSKCLVVEDAYTGIDAANSGGFVSVGISDAAKYEKATYTINRFEELLALV